MQWDDAELARLIREIDCLALDDTRSALLQLMQFLSRITGADRISWAAVYCGKFGRDLWQYNLLNGWKIMDTLEPGPDLGGREVQFRIDQYLERAKTDGLDPVVEWAIDQAVTTRIAWRGQFGENVNSHWHYKQLREENHIDDRLIAVVTVDAESESWFTLSRDVGNGKFSAENVAALNRALPLFPRLHYYLMLERGLLTATQPLSPREREVLSLLLSSRQDKQIAAELGVTQFTAHSYVAELYRKMQVRSRPELLRLWLQAVPTPPEN